MFLQELFIEYNLFIYLDGEPKNKYKNYHKTHTTTNVFYRRNIVLDNLHFNSIYAHGM